MKFQDTIFRKFQDGHFCRFQEAQDTENARFSVLIKVMIRTKANRYFYKHI